MQRFTRDMNDDVWPGLVDASNFDLYVKVREVSQICDFLQKITLLERKEQKKWAKENQIVIEDMLDTFLGDSVSTMSGIQLDRESMKLSMTLMEKMRYMTTTIYDLLPSHLNRKTTRKLS